MAWFAGEYGGVVLAAAKGPDSARADKRPVGLPVLNAAQVCRQIEYGLKVCLVFSAF